MKRIINGKAYDTDTAKLVGTWDNGQGVRDLDRVDETLYAKRTGEYFILGGGGPATRYAKRDGASGWVGGERIMPLTYEQARAWAEEKLEVDAYESEFGPVSEDADDVDMHVRVSAAAYNKVKMTAAARGVSVRDVIEQLIAAL